MDTISAPLWLTRLTVPSRSRSVSSTTDEQSARWWCGTISPMQLGPMMRVPVRAEMSTSSACRAMPSGPASANPVVMITQQPTPACAASRTCGTDRCVRLAAQYLAAVGIDGIDVAGEPVLGQEAHDAAAELLLAVRGAEH